VRIPAPRSAKPWLRQYRHLLSRWWRSVLVVQDTPHRVAWGFAIGMFIGWLPIVSIQMVVAAVLAWLLRGNVVASLPPVWITNPVTMVPIYYLCNQTGALVAGKAVSLHKVRSVISEVAQMDPLAALRFVFTELFDVVVATFIGGAILGVLAAIPCYVLVKMTVTSYQRLRMERRLRWLGIIEPPQPTDVHPTSVTESEHLVRLHQQDSEEHP